MVGKNLGRKILGSSCTIRRIRHRHDETFKMGALRHPYGAERATSGHARPRRAGTAHVAAPDGHVAQLHGGQAAKKAAVEAPVSRTGRDGAYLHYQWGELPKPTG